MEISDVITRLLLLGENGRGGGASVFLQATEDGQAEESCHFLSLSLNEQFCLLRFSRERERD